MEENPRERIIEEVEEDDDDLNQLYGGLEDQTLGIEAPPGTVQSQLLHAIAADSTVSQPRQPGEMRTGLGGSVGGDGTILYLEPRSNQVGGLEDRTVGMVATPGTVQSQPLHGMALAHGTVSQSGQSGGTRTSPSGGTISVGEGSCLTVGGGTNLFVSNLHWWTRNVDDLEAELEKYGRIKEMNFHIEKDNGKSIRCCWVEFYDPIAATRCQERMNGHVFNGRPCVVSFSRHWNLRITGEEQVKDNEQIAQQRTRDARLERGNWERGNAQGMGSRGPLGAMSNRPAGAHHRGFTRNVGIRFTRGVSPTPPLMPPWATQGLGNVGVWLTHGVAPIPPLMPPWSIWGPDLGSTFGGPVGVIAPIMGNYGAFPGAATPLFLGMMPPFPGPVGNVGPPGLVAHRNSSFHLRGRSMRMDRRGIMPNYRVGRPNMGGGRGVRLEGYEEVDVSDRESRNDREKDTSSDSDLSERKHRDERAIGHDRSHGRDREHSRDRDHGYSHDQDGERSSDQNCEHSRVQEFENYPGQDCGRSRDLEYPRYQDCGQSSYGDRAQSCYRDCEGERDKDHHMEERDKHVDHNRHRDREPQQSDEGERGQSTRTQSDSRVLQEEDEHPRTEHAKGKKR